MLLFLLVVSCAMGAPLEELQRKESEIEMYDTKEDGTEQYHPVMVSRPITMRFVAVRRQRYTSFMDMLSDRLGPESPKTINFIFRKNVMYPVEKIVPFPMKEYIDVPKPYHVPVFMEKKVPVLVEKKVPVKVEVPVEKPYPVEVAVPYEVTVVKEIPFIVEKKVPYPVHVPEYIGVPEHVVEKEVKSENLMQSSDHHKLSTMKLEKK